MTKSNGLSSVNKNKKDGKYKGDKNELLGVIHTTDWLKDPESFAREGRIRNIYSVLARSILALSLPM